MKGNEVRLLIQGVPSGTVLKLVYKMDSPEALRHLIGMMVSGIIEDDPETLAQAREVGLSGKWGKGQNPNHISLKTTEKFNVEWFVSRVAYPLESLIVEKPEPEKASLITGPEEATYSAQANLLDAIDSTASLGVSVNIGETNTYCDFWVRDFGIWRRVLKQRVIQGYVDKKRYNDLLKEEVRRFVYHPEIGPKIHNDLRLTLGVTALQLEIDRKL